MSLIEKLIKNKIPRLAEVDDKLLNLIDLSTCLVTNSDEVLSTKDRIDLIEQAGLGKEILLCDVIEWETRFTTPWTNSKKIYELWDRSKPNLEEQSTELKQFLISLIK